jgi:hypothetical protein
MRCTPGIEVGVVLSNLAYLNCLDFRSEGDWQSKAARRELNHASNIRQSSKLSRIESKTPEIHIDWVNQPLSAGELDQIRDSVNRGTPYGSADWVSRMAFQLGLGASLRPRGRPGKEIEM